MKVPHNRAIVAIDPTTRGIAFVFFENGEVMDWGERLQTHYERAELQMVDALIDSCAADVLVLEDPDADGSRRRARVRALLRALAKHARRRQVRVATVARAAVRRSWAARGMPNKTSVAVAIAAKF
ncbi:MAG TPA: hypothetical protein VJ865_07675, partial [Gemmatimonadaceae bacterium]|nr:hypothetical protein [Gemmatimonadaceae bacterium]